MPESTAKTYVITGPSGTIELQADRVEQDMASSRIILYKGGAIVGSFINAQSWYEKPAS